MSQISPPVLLDANEASAWCRITVHTLNWLRAHGRFASAIKIGRRVFWTPEELNAWIESQREPA